MPKILMIYGTTDGHTKKIADKIASVGQTLGCSVDVVNARNTTQEHRPENYDAVIVAASVHLGSYQRSVRHWVRRSVENLNRVPSAFVSVCLAVMEHRAEPDAEIKKILNRFFNKSGWRPTMTQIVAGALPYTRYGFIKKWVMREISRRTGGDTDISHDYEYTDWPAIEQFTREFTARIGLDRMRA